MSRLAIKKPLLITIPHSGEKVPPEAKWLEGLPETLLMFDVDRYVDKLYAPVIKDLHLPSVKTEWHRYAADLNRWKDDVDQDSVIGHANPSGKFPRGLHWVITTKNEKLLPAPMTRELHDTIVEKYFEPFHREVRENLKQIKDAGAERVYHIDAHSMPSVGTSEHRDPGEHRAEAVISDCEGKSCSSWFLDLVVSSYETAGFKVRVNWPYKGGRVTETYGKPSQGQESIQVELNRGLYMNEATKRLNEAVLSEMQNKISLAIKAVHAALPAIR
ncbi:MAG: N-formylglutamate amidohydrolase [Bdellovibrionota bacterium]